MKEPPNFFKLVTKKGGKSRKRATKENCRTWEKLSLKKSCLKSNKKNLLKDEKKSNSTFGSKKRT